MIQTLTHSFRPRGAAKDVFAYRGDEIVLAGPAGTGKSRACLEKLHLSMLVNPGARGLIVRKTRESCTSTALETYRVHVAPESIFAGDVEWYGGSAQESPQYRYTNGSVIRIGGMDKSTKIMSTEYDMIYVQEATELTEHDWQALTTRLRNGKMSFQQLLADCNPSFPTHWLKLRSDSGTTRMLESRHEDNPVYFSEDGKITPKGAAYLSKLDALTGVDYYRLRKGLWVAAEGVIFGEFDAKVHVIDRFEIPREWRRFWSMDFGFTHPMVVQRWAEDPDGRLYMYGEYYRTRETVDVIAREHRDILKNEPAPEAIIADHDAEGREVFSREIGIPTVPAKKTVLDGIQAVQRRMRPREDGRPGMFFFRDALMRRDQRQADEKKPTSTLEEIPGYIWRDHAKKEEPVKEADDGCDAMRYLIAHKDLQGEYRVRWL